MVGFLVWLVLAIVSFVASAMLASYALWYWENQKVLDLARHIKSNNTSSILEKSLGKRGFSSFDLSASINRSRNIAKTFVSGTVSGMQGISKRAQESGILSSLGSKTKRAVSGAMSGFGTLIKPVQDKTLQEELPRLTPEEEKIERYEADVEKIIDEATPEEVTPEKATLDIASGSDKQASEDLSLFEKLELRILNRLKESGMTNYDIWLELGSLYKKFGQNDKAKEVFALVLKHSSDLNKERARNELIGLS